MSNTMTFGSWYMMQRNRVHRDFQNNFLDDILEHRFSAIIGSRQIGKTRTLSIASILLAGGISGGKEHVPAHDVYIVSETYAKAIDIIKEIQRLLKQLNLIEKISHNRLGGKTEAVLTNGHTITALAGKDGCLQGYSGSVIWDEMSISQSDQSEIYAQALSVASSQPYFKVVFATNADRYGSWVWSFFHSNDEDWQKIRGGFKIHDINIYSAYPGGLPPQVEDVRRRMPKASWNRFFLNQFVSGQDGRWDKESIELATQQTWTCPDGLKILSIDPGWTVNPSGVVIVSMDGGYCHVIETMLWFRCSEEEQRDKIRDLVRAHGINRIVIDQGTQGMILRDNLIKEYGAAFVIPVSVSRQKMVSWAVEIEKLLIDQRLRIPANSFLVEDMHGVEVGNRGEILVTERSHTDGKSKLHCDAAMALMQVSDHLTAGGMYLKAPEVVEIQDQYQTDSFGNTVFGFDDDDGYDKYL